MINYHLINKNQTKNNNDNNKNIGCGVIRTSNLTHFNFCFLLYTSLMKYLRGGITVTVILERFSQHFFIKPSKELKILF